MLNIKLISIRYGFKTLIIKEQLGGLTSKNYSAITDDNNEIIIKVYKGPSLQSIIKSTLLSKLLSGFNKVIPKLILTANGESYLNIKNQYITIYSKINGFNLDCDKFSKLALINTANQLAEFHKTTLPDNIILPYTINMLKTFTTIKSQAESLESLINEKSKGNHVDHITKNLVNLKIRIIKKFPYLDEIEKFLSQKNQLIHGDFHHENILFNYNTEVIGIIDLDEVHYGHPLEDIMHFIHLVCCNNGFSKTNLANARTFFQQYISNSLISEEETIMGIHLYIYQIASSFFLENKMYNSDSNSLFPLIKRDTTTLEYLTNHVNEFSQEVLF